MTKADILLLNGAVHTVDSQNSVVEAVAISGNRIIDTGSSQSIRSLAGDSTQTIDLAGRTVLPGFIDAHVHMGAYGTNKLGIDCKAAGMRSIEEIKAGHSQASPHRAARHVDSGARIRSHSSGRATPSQSMGSR